MDLLILFISLLVFVLVVFNVQFINAFWKKSAEADLDELARHRLEKAAEKLAYASQLPASTSQMQLMQEAIDSVVSSHKAIEMSKEAKKVTLLKLFQAKSG